METMSSEPNLFRPPAPKETTNTRSNVERQVPRFEDATMIVSPNSFGLIQALLDSSILRSILGNPLIHKVILFFANLGNKLIRPKNLPTVPPHVWDDPVEHFLYYSRKNNRYGHFSEQIDDRRVKLLNEVLRTFGTHWAGIRVLEPGGGHGDFGAFLAKLGADVLMLDVRQENVNFANLKYRAIGNFKAKKANFIEMNVETLGTFDCVVLFGMLEALDEKALQVLDICSKLSKTVLLEALVCDSSDSNLVKLWYHHLKEKGNDTGLNSGRGAIPSGPFIEKFFNERGFRSLAVETEALETQFQTYSWKVRDTGSVITGLRRFWIFSKPGASLQPVMNLEST